MRFLSALVSASRPAWAPAAGFVCLGASLCPGAAPARAAEAPSPAPPAAMPAPAPAPTRGPDDRRPVPDYDGRPEPTTAGDVALWVPRVVLFPLYLVSEYLIRRPLGWLLTTAEREHWPTLLIDFFTFEERKIGIIPTFVIDLGLRPSVGLYVFWNDFLVPGNELRLRGTYGGEGWYQLRATDRFPLGPGQLSVTGAYEKRPDNIFYGVGDDGSDTLSRYESHVARGDLLYRVPWFRSSYARFGLDLRQADLDGGGCCGDSSLDEQVAAGAYPLPAGMNQVYDLAGQAAEIVLDSRWPRFPEGLELASDWVAPPGTGVRFAVRAAAIELLSQSLAPREALADAWLRYGASLGAHYDVTGQQRAVSATVAVDFVNPLGGGEVPLTDLVSLGGERPLRGFLANRFVDRSAAVLRLEYRWPVAVWLDGTLQYETGNVFGQGLDGFELSDFRSSYGLGLAAVGAQDHPFQALIAVGTERYSDGGAPDSFRLVFGTTAGF